MIRYFKRSMQIINNIILSAGMAIITYKIILLFKNPALGDNSSVSYMSNEHYINT